LNLRTNISLYKIMTVHNLFTPEECLRIINDSDMKEPVDAGIGKGQVEQSVRKTIVHNLQLSDKNRWFGEKILPVVMDVNSKVFYFDIYELSEMAMLEYNEGSFYDWHYDVLTTIPKFSTRKLSLIIFLSNRNDYEGGQLTWDFTNAGQPLNEMEQGSMVIFPSYMIHKVEPVIKGKRYTLAAWIHGNAFR
jgi:PKHD-type hydroxylase